MDEEVTINLSKIPLHRIEVDLHPTSVPKWKWKNPLPYYIQLEEDNES